MKINFWMRLISAMDQLCQGNLNVRRNILFCIYSSPISSLQPRFCILQFLEICRRQYWSAFGMCLEIRRVGRQDGLREIQRCPRKNRFSPQFPRRMSSKVACDSAIQFCILRRTRCWTMKPKPWQLSWIISSWRKSTNFSRLEFLFFKIWNFLFLIVFV